MKTHRTALRDIPEALDPIRMVELRQRFMQVNHQRLARVSAALNERQQIFVELLPLLVHANHPLLPGFVSHNTPAGLSGFSLTPAQVQHSKRFARHLNLQTLKPARQDIWGLFLMGSLGTLAHTVNSDFDIWLCYNPDLSPQAVMELQKKAENISGWAEKLGLEVHFFLINEADFREGKMLPMSSESSGSAQRLLLLDEFYRTSIWLAGRLPVWWFVPPDIDAAGGYTPYAQALQQQRFLAADECIDFGSCAQVAASEFVGAGLWQLYKAIESPYKSVLKLFLLEVYAKQIQSFNPLSSQFKQAIYQGQLAIDSLDPYIAAYQFVADYLTALGDVERLAILRRSLYFKVNILLSKPFSGREKSWQRARMEALIKQWRWGLRDLVHLDARAHWKTQEVMREREDLVAALTRSFREMGAFAKQSAVSVALDGMDFVLLRNKLAAAFAPRPGKILAINPGISRDLSAPVLRLAAQADAWVLNDELGNRLQQHPCLCALLVGAIFNQIVVPSSVLEPPTASVAMLVASARPIIHRWLRDYNHTAEHVAFAQPESTTQVLLMVNWSAGQGNTPPHRHYLSDKFDPFNYGPNGENRVFTIDAIYRNSWGEIFHQQFSGTDAVFALLNWYWKIQPAANRAPPPSLAIEVLDAQHGACIAQRLRHCLADIVACFERDTGPQSRYLLALGNQLHCLYWRNHELIPLTIYNEADLWNFLAVPQLIFRSMVMDRYCLQGHRLHALLPYIRPCSVSVFYQISAEGLLLIVVDECGSFFKVMLDRAPKLRSLLNLLDFIRASLAQLAQLKPNFSGAFGVVPIAFFEMQNTPTGWQLLRKNFDLTKLDIAPIPVKVLVHETEEGACAYSFFCEGRAFIPAENNNALRDLSTWLLGLRVQGELYPLFISEIVFARPKARVQLLDYLKAKRAVEALLNRTLTDLLALRR